MTTAPPPQLPRHRSPCYNRTRTRQTRHNGRGARPAAVEDRAARTYPALRIFPALMHEVHTRMCWLPLSVATRTRCRFGIQRRLVWRIELLTLCPVEGPFPQTWQTLATSIVPLPAGAPWHAANHEN